MLVDIPLKLDIEVIELERIAVASALRNSGVRPVRVTRNVNDTTSDFEIIRNIRKLDELDVLGVGSIKVSDVVSRCVDIPIAP